MTKDDIIALAQEAGWEMPVEWDANCLSYNDGFLMRLKRFAELLEAKVRKECAAICRKEAAETDRHLSIVVEALEDCAYFIEKRGEK